MRDNISVNTRSKAYTDFMSFPAHAINGKCFCFMNIKRSYTEKTMFPFPFTLNEI